MISIIICSINPMKLQLTLESIKATIGTDYEIIVYDNRPNKRGICQVYNECANKAVGDYLCFVHEDVLFNTSDWGNILVGFVQNNKQCGVVGFGGGEFVSKFYLSWFGGCLRGRNISGVQCHYTLPDARNSENYVRTIVNPLQEKFAPVITLDGYFLFCNKNVWEKIKFDEITFNGFHFYDQDFTFACYLNGYKNYVCHLIETIHLSRGNYSVDYYDSAKTFRHKYRLHKSISLNKISLARMCLYNIVTLWELFSFGKRMGETNRDFYNELYFLDKRFYALYFSIVQCLFVVKKIYRIFAKK